MKNQKEHSVRQAIEDDFNQDDPAGTDACYVEVRDQAPPKEAKPQPQPKKRGRKA